MTAQERYRNDPLFHALVDTIYGAIVRLELTPTEVRDAAMLAAIMYDMNHMRHSIRPDLDRKMKEPQ